MLSQREVVKLISGGRESGDLGAYLSAKSIQPFLPDKFRTKGNYLIISAGEYRPKTGQNRPINECNVLIFKVGSTQVNRGLRWFRKPLSTDYNLTLSRCLPPENSIMRCISAAKASQATAARSHLTTVSAVFVAIA